MAPQGLGRLLRLALQAGILVAAVAAAGSADVERVQVEVFYETLCWNSMEFITNVLYKAWMEFEKYDGFDLAMYPFGKARMDKAAKEVTCHHGPDECFLNTVQACVIDKLGWNPALYLPTIHCMEVTLAASTPKLAAEPCIKRNPGLNYEDILTCERGKLGKNLTVTLGEITDHERERHGLDYVPWVVMDDKPVKGGDATYDVSAKAVCDRIRGGDRPPLCR